MGIRPTAKIYRPLPLQKKTTSHCYNCLTHRLQPLDRSLFKPLGSYYTREQTKWLRNHSGMKIMQYQISGLLNLAYGDAATPNTAARGFEASGIWPLNRNKFSISDFVPAENLRTTETVTEELRLTTTEAASPMTSQTAQSNLQSTVLADSVSATPSTSNLATPSTSKTKKSTTLVASNPDTSMDETPSSKFQKALKKISPIPKATLEPANTTKRGRPAASFRPQKAVELTSSPYKNELMRKSVEKSNKNTVKNKRKSKTTAGDFMSKKRKLFDNADEEENVDDPQPIKTVERRKSGRVASKPVTYTNKNEENEPSSSEDSDSDDVACIYCNELFSRSWTARDRSWIKCQICQKWAHTACAGVDSHKKT